MANRKAATPKPAGKGPMVAWVACGGVLVVLSFLFGTMVGDNNTGPTATAANNPNPVPTQTTLPNQNSSLTQLQPGVQPVGADQVPEHIRNSAAREPGTGTRAPVQATPAVIDLGNLAPNQTVPATTQILNTGTEPLTIRSSRANCGCTTVDMAGTVIPPGRSVPLNATFNSQANIGPRSANISVFFEGYDEPVQVNISANVQG